MLPGGVSVLGLYLFCPDAAHTSAVSQLAGLLSSLAAFCLPSPDASSTSTSSSSSSPDTPTELLLLHIDASSRKQSLKAFPAAASPPAPPSSLRPCELKFSPALGSLVAVRCWHGVDVTLTVPAAAGAEAGGGGGGGAGKGAGKEAEAHMRRHLAALVAAEAERIRSGVFTVGGAVVSEAGAVGEALSAGAVSGSPLGVPTYDLTLLAPPPCQLLPPGGGAEGGPQGGGGAASMAVAGQARLRGALQGLAFVGKRETAGRAAAELQADLVSSLTARMELLLEEALRTADAAQGQQGAGDKAAAAAEPAHPLLSPASRLARGGCDLALPRRVLLPWLGGQLALCDHLLEGEPADAAAERARELLALQDSPQVIEEEQPASPAAPPGPWRPNAVPAEPVDGSGKRGGGALSGVACGGAMVVSAVAAAGAAVLAAAMGYMSLGGPAGSQ
ncbi:hypothetical protein HYH03_016034 [Edaphochlamys debaryana]|uniref:Uncharacterized protein n=1 Tax=Edaphochlamys debaryana TaxID=47281 RepID=A0A836BS20_9CHLO|nr:hypothetical protein HYH03_016034 [Edaphochlamys debaryana]|eukprot:KAG2485248.1 hypothetical protein HYH03_016034 [Edaphochlamys debaryana]